MKNKYNQSNLKIGSILSFILGLCFILLIQSCKKDDPNDVRYRANAYGLSAIIYSDDVATINQYFWINNDMVLFYCPDDFDLQPYQLSSISPYYYINEVIFEDIAELISSAYWYEEDKITAKKICLNFLNENKLRYKFISILPGLDRTNRIFLFNRISNVNY